MGAAGPGTAGRYPTQLPDALGRALARMANIGPGDVVLDPFVGSGALLVGAHEQGATALGCDIAPLAIRQAPICAARAAPPDPLTRAESGPTSDRGRRRSHPAGNSSGSGAIQRAR